MSKRVFVQAGHTLSGKGTGAVGLINESKENRVVTDSVIKWLKQGGATVYTGNVDSSSDYLNTQTSIANKYSVDVAVQIHFNSSDNSSAHGTETYYATNNGKVYAERVNKELSKVFYNRGAKTHSKRLHWLHNTKAPAILIETCFVSSKSDTDIYKSNIDKIGKAIAEGILGIPINTPQSNGKLYAVCVTACEYESAKKMQQELINKGYKDTYLIPR